MEDLTYKVRVEISTNYFLVKDDEKAAAAFFDMGMFFLTGNQDGPLAAHNKYKEDNQ